MDTVNKMDVNEFFNELKRQRGISDIWQKILGMFSVLEKEVDEDCRKFFCLVFSLFDDGNTCVMLDEKDFTKRWNQKWEGLLLVSGKESTLTKDDFSQIIKKGIEKINNGNLSSLIQVLSDEKKYTSENTDEIKSPFVIKEIKGNKWLFTERNFAAKVSIEERVKVLFPAAVTIPDFEKKHRDVIKYFKENTKINSQTKESMELNEQQADAVILGQYQNLIVTGGPGTGKTTTICYLLWELMKQTDADGVSYCDYNLYLAAPSGKAAERMKESITDSLNDFKEETINLYPNIMKTLTEKDSSTIHRLLRFNPSTNGFSYNKNNQFEKKSIFIIDEASMIDINLFKCLLEAIPEGARVFILGDKDQLPSVQAGAVLEELLKLDNKSVVKLILSMRFNEKSEVGRLKNELQNEADFPETMETYGTWLNEPADFTFSRGKKSENPVFLYSLKEMDKENKIPKKADQIKEILKKWSKVFAEDLTQAAKLPPKKSLEVKQLSDLWNLTQEAKILCAEREGIRGVEAINNQISSLVCKNTKTEKDDDGYFVGQLLMLTQNQSLFRLYNGDSGVVVSFEQDELKYLMVEKKASQDEQNTEVENEDSGIFRFGDFLFYPIYILPKEAIDIAYAITIHKSQGSGYSNIMVVLPEQIGHPLLNRQIFYTGVTRTKGYTYIIASLEAMNYAKKTKIERSTMIEL